MFVGYKVALRFPKPWYIKYACKWNRITNQINWKRNTITNQINCNKVCPLHAAPEHRIMTQDQGVQKQNNKTMVDVEV